MSTIATRSTPSARSGGCRDRDVVVEAEAHRAIGFSVVARRPDERERGLSGGARMAGRVDRGARGEQCDFMRFRAGERVASSIAALPAGLGDRIEIPRLCTLASSSSVASRGALTCPPPPLIGGRNLSEQLSTFRPLGMSRRRRVLDETRR
jgi:hypothetical protein